MELETFFGNLAPETCSLIRLVFIFTSWLLIKSVVGNDEEDPGFLDVWRAYMERKSC